MTTTPPTSSWPELTALFVPAEPFPTGWAGSRLLLQDRVHDQVLERLLSIARTARMGDPMDPTTQVGPVTTRPQYEKVLGYIDIARAEGAKL